MYKICVFILIILSKIIIITELLLHG